MEYEVQLNWFLMLDLLVFLKREYYSYVKFEFYSEKKIKYNIFYFELFCLKEDLN